MARDLATAAAIHEAARRWLVTYDPEGAATWLAAGPDADLVMDVVQNLTTFGLVDGEGDETAAQEGLAIVAASHRLNRAAALVKVATADMPPPARPAPHPGEAVVRLLGELQRDIYAETAAKALGIKLVVDPMLFGSVARAIRSSMRGGDPYRANGETCVDVITPMGPITITQGREPLRWTGGRF